MEYLKKFSKLTSNKLDISKIVGGAPVPTHDSAGKDFIVSTKCDDGTYQDYCYGDAVMQGSDKY